MVTHLGSDCRKICRFLQLTPAFNSEVHGNPAIVRLEMHLDQGTKCANQEEENCKSINHQIARLGMQDWDRMALDLVLLTNQSS